MKKATKKTKKPAAKKRVDIYPNRVMLLVVVVAVMSITLYALLGAS